MNNYSEALEQQVAVLRWLDSPTARAHFGTMPAVFGKTVLDGLSQHQIRQFQTAMCSAARLGADRGETFYWSPRLCQLLVETAPSLPDWTLTADSLPARDGFMWFASPLHLPGDDANAAPLCAASWITIDVFKEGQDAGVVPGLPDGYDGAHFPTTAQSDVRIIQVVFYVREPWRWHGAPVSVVPWVMGRPLSSHVDQAATLIRVASDERYWAKVRYLATAFAFMQQRLLATSKETVDRAARRRLVSQDWAREPVVRVVHLRRIENTQGEHEGGASRVDWACQWMVRGHWRQQSCGAAHQQRRPVYVLPHIKGPDDKPLKAPRATVFAVVR